MQTLFLNILDMSIVASIVIMAVLAVRLLIKRAPKVYSYALWAVVLFRLLCPFTIESALSLIPGQVQEIPQEMALETTEHVTVLSAVDAAQRAVGDVVNGGIGNIWVRLDSEEVGNHGVSMATHRQVWLLFLGCLWPVGILGMLIYSVASCVKLQRKLVGAVLVEDGTECKESKESKESKERIYLADYIESPFVMGGIRPRIYLPSSLAESEREYIILHEQHHIRRGDHIVKLLAFAALCIHWFNPLVWIAFVEAGKDMEMSCDEAVIRDKGEQIRAEYSASLLQLATGKRIFAGMPLAFGEGDTKGRIKNLAKWKKPKLLISAAAIMLCTIVAVVCIVNPKSTPDPAEVVGEGGLMKEIPHVDMELVPGTTYVPHSCIYMNLASSTISNDTGYCYLVEEDSFTATHRISGNKTTYDSIDWQWQEFPWTDEEWSGMFLPSSLSEIKISQYYDERLYIELSKSDCLLWMDGQLWLVKIHENPRRRKYIWSIYALVPEGDAGHNPIS